MHTIKPTYFKQYLSLGLSSLFICQPLMAAEIVLDTRTHTVGHTMLDTAANGTPVVNIARPNTNGVSHNTYIEFNVPTQGTILNNAGQEVNTQLAGYIYGNENLRDGSASLILNEVSGTNRSRLNGYLEVAGPSADVIVANPNGITVNGAGFINIPKATLTTGKVNFNGDRPIFDIEGGDIFIDGKGLDARGTSSLELYTQALKLNAKLHANDLQVVTGLNHIDENGKVTSRDSEGETRPAFSIDSTALGGIYANAISLVGTQKGVGVNLPVEMLVQERLELSADGRIVLGKVSVQNKATIRSESSAIEVHEGVHAESLELQAMGDITLKGNTGAVTDLTLQGNRLTNEGIIAAGVHADFTQAQEGLLSLGFTESIHNTGVLYGLSGTAIDTKDFINADKAEVIAGTLRMNAEGSLTNAGRIHANDVMELTAGSFDNTYGMVEGLDSVTIDIAGGFMNQSGVIVAGSTLALTTNTLDNTEGSIQANETLTLLASGDIDNTRGTFYSGAGTTVTAQTLNNEEGFIGSIKAVLLDLFHWEGDHGTVSGEGVTVHTETMQSSYTTLLSSDGIDIDASGDVTLTNSTMLATGGLNLTASGTTLNGSTLYSTGDSISMNTAALQAQNVYMEAKQLLNLNASQQITISDSTMRGSSVQVSAEEYATLDDIYVEANDALSIETQTLDLHNAALSAENSGTIHAAVLNNSDSMVSAAQMDIDTVTFNNTDSYLYSAGGILNITAADTMDNRNGLVSANGNLAVEAQHLDNRNGELEAGNTLAVSSGDLQIENSRFFAGEYLDVTSNIATIDAATKFLSANAMDLDFAGDLQHHGEILANGRGNINVQGDLDNEGSITANGSLHLTADTLTNNANDTGASIRGGQLSDIMLSGDLNNHGFLTSSGDLEITAASVHNYAGIAVAYGLTLHSTDLYNYHTLVSGTDMQLYISDLLSNKEEAEISAGANLIIASDETGGKTGRVENSSGRIESGSDMHIAAGEISNISVTEITTTLQKVNGRIDITCDIWESFSCPALAIPLETDLMAIKDEIIQEYSDKGVTLSESELQGLLTERMVQEDREAYILNMYKDTKTTAGELYFNELTASLDRNAMIVKRIKPHKKEEFRKVDYRVTEEVVDATLLANHKEGEIISGRNLSLDADTITNRTSLIAAGNDIAINGNLFNIAVESTESIDATINYSWKRKSDSGLGQLPVSKSEIRDTEGVPSQILAGGTLTGNFGVLQNGMESGASVNMDPTAPTISTSTQTTEEAQQTVTLPDTNANLANIDQGTIENTALALTPQVYDPAVEAITLPDDAYGVFITSPDPDGPLIESNPEYTDYRNFVSSDYMLDRLGYDGSSQLRRLGDAMYETQLIRDAVMAMTGERYIGTVENDNDQYIDLMQAGIAYAQEVGLELGVPPTALQLKDLKEDLVWMEEKTVQGQQVLVPVLYLAKAYNKPTGANIAANRMDLTVDGHLNNSGNMQTREEMQLRTGTLTNNRGNMEAGKAMKLSAIGDIQNLSGSMKGGAVVLKSEAGNIVNKTLSKRLKVEHSVGKEHYTLMDKTASMEATKGALVLDAGKNIENAGASLASKEGMLLKAKEDVTIQSVQDTKSYDYTFDHGYAKGESVAHQQSDIKAGGLLDVKAGADANLEAVKIKAENARIKAEDRVNLTAVTDSSYSSSYVELDGSLSSSTVTDVSLQQSIKGTTIDTGIVQMEGKEGVTLESAVITANNAASITSQKGDVSFSAKSYTNASYHEESDSMMGGLISSRTVDAMSETQLAESSTSAESQILVGGKNVNLVATDLETTNGGIKLSAVDNVNIVSGMESQSETHIREESGLFQGGHLYQAKTDETVTYDESAKASSIKSASSVLIDAGSAEVIGSNIQAAEHIVVKTDVGSIEVKEAKEQHGNKETHEELNIDLKFGGAKVEDGKAKVTVASASYDKEELTENYTTSSSSNLQAGGTVQLTSVEDIKIQGSNIAAGGDVTLDAQGDVLITEAKDTMDSTLDEMHATAEVSVSVTHSAAQAAVAVQGVNDAKNQVKQAARDYRKYKKELKNHESTLATLQQELQEGKPGVSQEDIDELTELITESKEDEKYYTASIAAAGANLVSKTTQAAQALKGAAASAGMAGFSASLDLDVDGTKANTNTQSTSSTASTIQAGNTINIITGTGGGQKVLIQGSHLQAGNSINVETEEYNIVASKDTYRSETESEHISAHASVSTAGGYSASVSADKSHSRENQTTYSNSTLNANTINLTTTQDANIKGANIHGTKETNLIVGGNLNIVSVQNRTRTTNNSVGASAGISGSTGLDNPMTTGENQNESGVSKINGTNAGANTANGRSRSKETVLTSIAGATVNINTTGNTYLKGAQIAAGEVDEEGNFVDNGQLTLNTGTLTHSDLSNTSYESSTSASLNTNVSINNQPANPQDPTSTDQTDLNINSSQVTASNTQTTSKTKTLATLGEGTVMIGSVETEADSTLNRNTDTIDKEIYSVTQQQGNVDLTVDHRLLSEDGQAEIKEDMEKVGESTQIVASTLPSASDDNVILSALGTVLDTLSYATAGITPSEETNGGLLGNIPILFGDNDIEHKVLQVKSESMLTEENKDDFIPMKESEYYKSASQEDRDALDALGNLYVSKVPVAIDANNATYQNGTNGMMNNEIQALRNMITQTHVEGDTNINGTLNYNPTHGFLGDLIESGVDKNGGTTGIARQTGEFMYDVTHARGTSGANFANHSQGNALVYAGVNYINAMSGFDEAAYFIDSTKIREKQHEGLPSVTGFGSPMSYDTMNKLFVETGFEFTGNFTNENDYVGEGIGGNTGHNGSTTILKKLNLYNAALLFDVLPTPSPHGRYNCDPSKGQICGDRP